MTIATASLPHAAPVSRSERFPLAWRLAAAAGFVLLTAAAAQVSFPIPGTPVPVTLQTLAVTLAAVALGPILGTASMAAYLALGMLGLPVFADGSAGGSVIFGATGGYLLAFLAVPLLAPAALETIQGRSAGWRGVLAFVILSNVIIFALGAGWLMVLSGTTPGRALELGVYPFLPGTVIKSAMALSLGIPAAGWCRRRLW